jgi:uncharacterized protein (TIGR02284 family)
MKDKAAISGLLNDLIRINNDRVEGYHKAIEDLKPSDIDLRTMFTNMANHSAQFVTDLNAEVTSLEETPATDSTQPGKIYRLWMDIRATVTGRDRKSIIALCEFGEDAALKAYDAALEAYGELPEEVRQIIVNQRSNIKSAHDVVKRYRDMHEALTP